MVTLRDFKWYDFVTKMHTLYAGSHIQLKNVSKERYPHVSLSSWDVWLWFSIFKEIPLDPWSPSELEVFWSLQVRFSSGKRSYSFSQARGNTLHRRAVDGLFLWRKMLIIDLLSKVAFSWVGGLWWAVFPLLKLMRRWRQAGEKSMCKQMGSTLASCGLLFQCCLEKSIS